MSNLYHRSGTVAVRWYLGEHALGLYAAAARLADLLRNFLSSLLWTDAATVFPWQEVLRVHADGGAGRVVRSGVSLPTSAGPR